MPISVLRALFLSSQPQVRVGGSKTGGVFVPEGLCAYKELSCCCLALSPERIYISACQQPVLFRPCPKQEYDNSFPNWEFARMIKEFRTTLECHPLTVTDPVSKPKGFLRLPPE